MPEFRTVFEQMICEMDYHEMTVKALCERAKINKKTFCRYYPALDDLLLELQTEMSSEYIEMISHFRLPEEMDKVNEAFFRYSVSKGKVYEKITCASRYVHIRNTMIDRVNEGTWHKSAWFNNIPEWQRRLLIVYVQYTVIEMYKQWVADGKKAPVEDVTEMSNRLSARDLTASGIRKSGRNGADFHSFASPRIEFFRNGVYAGIQL